MTLGLIGLSCAVLSSRLGVPQAAYGVVAATACAIALCVWHKLDHKYLPALVYLLGLAFLLQTTLISDNLIGTDIHTEYFIFQKALEGWDTTYPHAYNTAVGSTVIAPALANQMGIPGYWIYKLVFPALFALVPLALFRMYRRMFGDTLSFVACVVFVTCPTYLIEMTGLPRQMLAELMLTVGMMILVSGEMRLRYRIPLLVIVFALGYLFHYVVGPVILMLLVGCLIVSLLVKTLRTRFKSWPKQVIPARWLAVAVIIPAVLGLTYYTQTANGVVAESLSGSLFWLSHRVQTELSVTQDNTEPTAPATPNNGTKATVTAADTPPTTNTVIVQTTEENYFSKQEPLIRTALGLDFAGSGWVGKLFRIFQFLTQIALLVGVVWLVRNRRIVTAEFLGLAVSSLVMLGACILLPRFSNIINATRFYHIALIALSPLIVLGAVTVFRNLKRAALLLVIPGLLINTGVLFEVSGENDISTVNAPYSIALSNYRLHAASEYTQDDLDAVQWVVDNSIEPVLTDINGMLILSQFKDPFAYINRSPVTGKYYTVRPLGEADQDGQEISRLSTGWGYLPQDTRELPYGSYILLTGWSNRNQMLTFKPNWFHLTDTASGMRRNYTFDELGLPGEFRVVFRKGDAVVLVKQASSDGRPVEIKWVERWSVPTSADPNGHSQGATTDGKDIWWCSGDLILKSSADDPNWGHPDAANNHPLRNGADQINGISVYGNKVYVVAPKFAEQPYRCWAFVFDKDTLEYIGEQELLWDGNGDTQEGMKWHDGYWWVVFFDRSAVARYSVDFQFVDIIPLPDRLLQVQGLAWEDNNLWIGTTQGPFVVYHWDGNTLHRTTSFPKPKELNTIQSFGFTPDGEFMYVADFDEWYEYLHKIRIVRDSP